jgi:hypothetical protein
MPDSSLRRVSLPRLIAAMVGSASELTLLVGELLHLPGKPAGIGEAE